MPSLPASLAPAFRYLASHIDVLIYLAPSLALAVVFRMLARRHGLFLLFYLAGTICHELAHFGVGLLTLAKPRSFSVIPHRSGTQWTLGAVEFANLRWYNAAPTALAPVLTLAIPIAVAAWRVAAPWSFHWSDAALAVLLAPQFLSFWPSRRDWLLALYSWPYLVAALAGYWLWWR